MINKSDKAKEEYLSGELLNYEKWLTLKMRKIG
jgi:hypothetical protein